LNLENIYDIVLLKITRKADKTMIKTGKIMRMFSLVLILTLCVASLSFTVTADGSGSVTLTTSTNAITQAVVGNVAGNDLRSNGGYYTQYVKSRGHRATRTKNTTLLGGVVLVSQ
jgi:hypothetical protein